MARSNRERTFTLALIAAVGIFAGDRFFLSPYLDWRNDLISRRQSNLNAIVEDQLLLQKERQLRPLQKSMLTSLAADASASERELLHLLHHWEQTAGVGNASFQRLAGVEEHGFTRLTFHISASGPITAVATLLFRLETASIPLRIDESHVMPKTASAGDDLLVRLTVSTLCRSTTKPSQTPEPTVAAAGGQP